MQYHNVKLIRPTAGWFFFMWFHKLTVWIEFCSRTWLKQNCTYTLSLVIKILTITLSESIIVLSRWAMVKTVQHLNLVRIVSWIKASVLWLKEMKHRFRLRMAAVNNSDLFLVSGMPRIPLNLMPIGFYKRHEVSTHAYSWLEHHLWCKTSQSVLLATLLTQTLINLLRFPPDTTNPTVCLETKPFIRF